MFRSKQDHSHRQSDRDIHRQSREGKPLTRRTKKVHVKEGKIKWNTNKKVGRIKGTDTRGKDQRGHRQER